MKKRALKVLAIGVVFVLSAQVFAFGGTVTAPPDCQGQPYEQEVTALMEKGIITGDTDGLYYPQKTLTRAEACKLVVAAINPGDAELFGTPTQKPAQARFSDVADTNWAMPYISYAVNQGIVTGYLDGTFKPQNDVKIEELNAMLIRACKIDESSLVGNWPENYVNKAAELGFYDGTGMVDQYGNYMTGIAQKWMAAWLLYNAIDEIEAANTHEKAPQGTSSDKVDSIPSASEMTFVQGSFDQNITSFAGKQLSNAIKIYTYEIEKNYSKDMEFSKIKTDYREDTVYKFKGVTTKAWYKTENGKITEMILPQDKGFSGYAYGVVNGLVETLNYNDRGVKALETITATKDITWISTTEYNGSMPTSAEINTSITDGDLYEIEVSNGYIINVTNNPAEKHGRKFTEISGTAFVTVTNVDLAKNLVQLGTSWFEIRENASIYIVNDDQNGFEVAGHSKIRKDSSIRLFDISDDDNDVADIVIIKKN